MSLGKSYGEGDWDPSGNDLKIGQNQINKEKKEKEKQKQKQTKSQSWSGSWSWFRPWSLV
jgi:hypothetical protein